MKSLSHLEIKPSWLKFWPGLTAAALAVLAVFLLHSFVKPQGLAQLFVEPLVWPVHGLAAFCFASLIADWIQLERFGRSLTQVNAFESSELGEQALERVRKQLPRNYGQDDLTAFISKLQKQMELALDRHWTLRWLALFVLPILGFTLGAYKLQAESNSLVWKELFCSLGAGVLEGIPSLILLGYLGLRGGRWLEEWSRFAWETIRTSQGERVEPKATPDLDSAGDFDDDDFQSRRSRPPQRQPQPRPQRQVAKHSPIDDSSGFMDAWNKAKSRQSSRHDSLDDETGGADDWGSSNRKKPSSASRPEYGGLYDDDNEVDNRRPNSSRRDQSPDGDYEDADPSHRPSSNLDDEDSYMPK